MRMILFLLLFAASACSQDLERKQALVTADALIAAHLRFEQAISLAAEAYKKGDGAAAIRARHAAEKIAEELTELQKEYIRLRELTR